MLKQGEAIMADGKIVRFVGASQDVTERAMISARLARANETLQRLSATDELTDVGNRRRVEQQLETEWSRAVPLGLPLGLLMLDIDHLKKHNDRYGHPGGDAAMRQVAGVRVKGAQRSDEIVARDGG